MGPPPVPFRQVVVKLTSRCDLACSYCYVYAGDGWRSLPRHMSAETLAATGRLIADHAVRHDLPAVSIVLHGGEPLLAGAGGLDEAASILRAATAGRTEIRLGLQTNGVLLNENILSVLRRHRIRTGVSLDGSAATHDARRRTHDGRPTYERAARAVRMLGRPENRDLFAGILCVVDPATDPVECFESLVALGPPRLDLLLPHGTWDRPPPGRLRDAPETPYADWLIAVFDRWYGAPVRETGIRLFESLMGQILGAPSAVESLGLEPVDLICVETDGSLEQVDSLKIIGPAAAATGLHVSTDSLDDALAHPGVRARQEGVSALAAACRSCPVVEVCGGGLYTHRFGAGHFRHPSVYCPDLFALIRHVRERMRTDLVALSAR